MYLVAGEKERGNEKPAAACVFQDDHPESGILQPGAHVKTRDFSITRVYALGTFSEVVT